MVGNPSLTRIMEGLPVTRGQTPSQHVHNLPEPDLNEAARAADASREAKEQWLPVG
jgi:hypothetical protein